MARTNFRADPLVAGVARFVARRDEERGYLPSCFGIVVEGPGCETGFERGNMRATAAMQALARCETELVMS